MFKLIPAILLVFFAANPIFAQDLVTRWLDISSPKMKIAGSLYSSLDVVDSRQDTVIGKVQIGLLKNRDALLCLRSPLQPVFTRIMDSLTGGSGAHGQLVFQLRDFNFVEEASTRYCFLSATLYVKNDTKYRKLADLDTVIILIAEGMVNVNKILAPEASKIISGFIAQSLVKSPADTAGYSFDDILHIDTIEKRQIPVYWRNDYVDGIYNSYSSFKQQLPDRQAMVKSLKDGRILTVTMLDEQARRVKVKPWTIYALVYQGKPYIATGYGYYPLIKLNNDLFFTGDLPVAHPQALPAGLVPALIVISITGNGPTYTSATYDAIIDYRNGSFIRLKQIPPPVSQ